MKFTCDSCGAHYQIADEKLGPRGVKVRCKKCSFVIVLRPTDAEDGAIPDPSERGAEPQSASRGEPAAQAAPRLETRPRAADADLLGTSSDFGLSREFRALGFEEEAAATSRAALGLELDAGRDQASPFDAERAGGSLDDLEAALGGSGEGLGASMPEEAPDGAESTRVDGVSPFGASSAGEVRWSASGEVDAPFGEPSPGAGFEDPTPPGSEQGFSLGLAGSAEFAREEGEVVTRVAGLGGPVPQHDEEPLTQHHRLTPAEEPADPWNREEAWNREEESDEGGETLAADLSADSSELADMRASLQGAFAGLGEAEASGDLLRGDAPQTAVGAPPEEGARPEDAWNGAADDGEESALDQLAALAREAEASDPLPPPSGPVDDVHAAPARPDPREAEHGEPMGPGSGSEVRGAAAAGPGPGAPEVPSAPAVANPSQVLGEAVLDDSIAAEIGSAFDAMFGVSEEENLDLGDGAPDPLGLGLDADRLQTRVFDTEAMAQVQAEQDRAVHAQPKPAGEWYVAVEEEQIGPLTFDELETRWLKGEISPNSLCWRAGMADWTAIRFTKGLEDLKPQPEAELPRLVEVPQEEEAALAGPPQIAPPPEPAKPVALAKAPVADEPDWRPSAASALASLAAEELAAPKPKEDVAVGPALPAASSALEKLLEGEPKPAAARFGAAEKSESFVRPLPRRGDTMSSIPLRDPEVERPRQNLVLPASIVGGALVLGLIIVFGLRAFDGKETPPTPPTPPVAAVQPSAAVAMAPAAPVEAAAPAPAEAPAAPPPEAAPAPVEAPPPAEAEAPVEAKAVVAQAPTKKERARAAKAERVERVERADRVERAVAPPPPPQPAARAVSDEDDLLGASKRRRPAAEPSSELPKQLDESDIWGVFRAKRGDVRACLEKQAAAAPGVEGTMTVRLVIQKDGSTTRVAVDPDEFKGTVAGKCVVDAVKRWRFPQFSGPNMPIDFPVRVSGR